MHNDIKMENILIGNKDNTRIYLIDFGLCKQFRTETGEHTKKIALGFFSGNYMFASLNSCRGNTKSRRDDMEALFYLIIYLINGNSLPWKDFKGSFA